MALVRNFTTSSQNPNTIGISWDMPIDFNNLDSSIIVTRTSSHYPVELYNPVFPTKATDPRPVELLRISTIVGLDTGTISVVDNILEDTSATFPISPSLTGRLVRDTIGQVFKILSNTATTLTLSGNPISGKYVILPDFPSVVLTQQTFETDARTEVGAGYIKNLVKVVDGNLVLVTFTEGELANCIFKDKSNNYFIIKTNTTDTIYFFESSIIPVPGTNSAVLNNFTNSTPQLFIDTYKNQEESDVREGTGLLNNTFYYYTAFVIPNNTNVAQAKFGQIDSGVSTQSSSISIKDANMNSILYNKLWPTVYRELDTSGDLEDLMSVFGFQFNELHALVSTYNLQSADTLFINAVKPMSEQTGLPSVGYSIGADTLRRIANEMISCWKLKGSKEGIALFIRMLTTWDITNGTADYNGAIQDYLPNVAALRFFDDALGSANTRLTQSYPSFVSGGRFAKSLPGIIIPGFFTFREFVIYIPNVALFIGTTQTISIIDGTTIIEDTTKNFGADDSLVGNFIIPNQEEVNDIYEIIENTSTSVTAKGIINNKTIGGSYVILSPLNTNRFIILNKLMPEVIPHGTKAGFAFI